MTAASPSLSSFADRLAAVQQQIAQAALAAGRDPKSVELLAVTKNHPAEAVLEAMRAGLNRFGENRVQEAAGKRPAVGGAPRWELIGHLQSNKCRLAVETFDRIQSVDSAKLVSHLAAASGQRGRVLPILLQINSGNDPAKFGAEPADAEALLTAALAHPQMLRVEGLMTIAPLGDARDLSRSGAQRTFARLREIRDELASRLQFPLPVLSMGMSGDLDIAIAEGSTLVRVGTALFGTRSTG